MIDEEKLKKRGRTISIKKTLSVQVKKSVFMLISTLLAIIVLVSIVYLLNSSQSSQKGYILKQEQIKRDKLIEESRIIINKTIEAKAFNGLNIEKLKNQMIKPEKMEYINPKEQ